jgi:hypothetical protein
MQSRKIMPLLAILLLALASAVSAATSNDPLSGKYEGVAKSPAIGDIPLTVEIKNDNGKLTGKLDTAQGPAAITSGTFADGKITMKFDAGGTEGTVNAELKGDKISGTWELGGQTGTLELTRMVVAKKEEPKKEEPKKEEPKSPPSAPAAGADPISGAWAGKVEIPGQGEMDFTLTLKLEADNKVTGSTESGQGSMPISKGTWMGDKLSFSLETPNGEIKLTAVLKEGKLLGDFDFASQFQGKWNAAKK